MKLKLDFLVATRGGRCAVAITNTTGEVVDVDPSCGSLLEM